MSKRRAPDPLREINHRFGGRALATGKVASDALRLASRRLLGADDGEAGAAAAADIARELDGMKGLAMKVGQILSSFDGVLPAEVHLALRTLQRGASAVAFETLVPVIEASLGAPLAQLFDWIDPEAIAAASIGQVHPAIHRGRAVAVKIQYPQVRDTLDADFRRLGAFARLASIATATDGAALADELRSRVLEECDYLREADHQEAFARAFAGDAQIVVPGVVRERTADRVLTTHWHDGTDLYGFAERAGREEKCAAGLVMARFAYRSLFGLGMLQADPHPGNYLFPAQGGVVFLDFGCVRRFEREHLEAERALTRIVIHDRRPQFREAVLATGMVPHPARFDFDAHWALLRHQLAPYCAPRFRFTAEYIREGMHRAKHDNPNLRRLAIPRAWIWQQRMQVGLHAALARLDAEGAFRDVLIEALERPSESSRAHLAADIRERAAATSGSDETRSRSGAGTTTRVARREEREA